MKKAYLIAFCLVLASIPGLSQPQSAASFDLAAILSSPAGSSCAAQLQSQNQAPERIAPPLDAIQAATCTTDCGMHGTLSCQWTTSCSAVNRNCPARGSVTCNGVTTLCPTCTTADYCYQCTQTSDCVSCCVCAGDTVKFCRDMCP